MVFGIVFNKDKKIGRELGTAAITLPEKQIQQINEILQDIKFSEIEFRRLRLCLSILNLASITWWVNLYERTGRIDINRVRKILDNALDTFMNNFIGDRTTVKIGDYILGNDEIFFLSREWGGVDITKETNTTIGTLVPSIYNIRINQYNIAFAERLKLASGERKGSLDPVAKMFVKHFAGENSTIKELSLVIAIAALSTRFDGVISSVIKDYIG